MMNTMMFLLILEVILVVLVRVVFEEMLVNILYFFIRCWVYLSDFLGCTTCLWLSRLKPCYVSNNGGM